MKNEKTEELDVELARLNKAVDDAVKARTEWMDANMTHYAKVQVGEEIYDADYNYAGIVRKLYRFWGDQRDWRFDTSMSVSYDFKTPYGYNSNTSGSRMYNIHSKADKEAHERWQYESLKKKFA